MLNNLQDEFILSETKAAQLPPLTLAYIGDCIFDLYVRTKHVLGCSKNAGKLHSMSIRTRRPSPNLRTAGWNGLQSRSVKFLCGGAMPKALPHQKT